VLDKADHTQLFSPR